MPKKVLIVLSFLCLFCAKGEEAHKEIYTDQNDLFRIEYDKTRYEVIRLQGKKIRIKKRGEVGKYATRLTINSIDISEDDRPEILQFYLDNFIVAYMNFYRDNNYSYTDASQIADNKYLKKGTKEYKGVTFQACKEFDCETMKVHLYKKDLKIIVVLFSYFGKKQKEILDNLFDSIQFEVPESEEAEDLE